MREYLQEAGWPVWMVLAFGALSLLTAMRYAAVPREGARLFALGAALTFAAGVLGLLLGVECSIKYLNQVPEPERLSIFLQGLRESMHNLTIAVAFNLAGGIATLAGALRGRRDGGVVPAHA